jgi:hypothetical protein
MQPTFALIRADSHEFDFVTAAGLLAESLAIVRADVLQQISNRGGILWEGLSEHQARVCETRLRTAGLSVRAIAELSLVELPEVLTIRAGRILEDCFQFQTLKDSGSIPWQEFVWINLAHVQRLDKETFDDWDVVGDSESGARVVRNKSKRLATRWQVRFDLVSYEPWLLLRIPCESFQFGATGLTVHPNRRQNVLALAVALAARAEEAVLGPGLTWCDEHRPPDDLRIANERLYEEFVRWQLTLAFNPEE